MMFVDRLAAIALSVSARVGAGFWPAVVITSAEPTMDAGGSIIAPGVVTQRDCFAQVDVVTQAMRSQEGYAEGDVRVLVLAGTLSGGLDTDARIRVTAGPHAGLYSVRSVTLDVAATHWDCRGRPERTSLPPPIGYVPSLDFSDARNSQYLAILFMRPSGGAPVGGPSLDFGEPTNSQYLPLVS